MPIFSNKFTPKKTPHRKAELSTISKQLGPEHISRELGLQVGDIKFRLGHSITVFEDGKWAQEPTFSKSDCDETAQLKSTLHQVEEQNNILKLKIEILLDMLAECTAESHLQEREIKKLRQ